MTDTPIDPSAITTWKGVVVAALLLAPTLLTAWGNRSVKNVEKTLTTNNGGSHIKDSLDRIEARQVTQEKRLDTLEASVSALQKPSGLLSRFVK